MRGMDNLALCLGAELGEAVRREAARLAEVRIRCGRASRLRMLDGSEQQLSIVNARQLRQIVNRLSENSIYAWENEMRQGYFTVSGGLRVGVCGKMSVENGRIVTLANIASLCIRIPREIPGCAGAIVPYVVNEGLHSALILSPPGYGKTTMIRDLARLVSDGGYNVAIADERREIAACLEGVPQLDVGERTDVMDNCPKALALPMLIRACAPELLLADEIGGMEDAAALEDAAFAGVAVAVTAHATDYERALKRPALRRVIQAGVFEYIFTLGGHPGQVTSFKIVREGEARQC